MQESLFEIKCPLKFFKWKSSLLERASESCVYLLWQIFQKCKTLGETDVCIFTYKKYLDTTAGREGTNLVESRADIIPE